LGREGHGGDAVVRDAAANPTGRQVPQDRLIGVVAGGRQNAAVVREGDAKNHRWCLRRGLERRVFLARVHAPRPGRVARHPRPPRAPRTRPRGPGPRSVRERPPPPPRRPRAAGGPPAPPRGGGAPRPSPPPPAPPAACPPPPPETPIPPPFLGPPPAPPRPP